MLVITESDTKYHKRHKNVRNVDTVKKHLTDAKLAALGDDNEEPKTSENV